MKLPLARVEMLKSRYLFRARCASFALVDATCQLVGSRGGNRGCCARHAASSGKTIGQVGNPLSMHDLCLAAIGALGTLGVASLKIEGG